MRKMLLLLGCTLVMHTAIAGIWDTDYGVDSLFWKAGAGIQASLSDGSQAPFLRTANQWDRYAFGSKGISGWISVRKELSRKKVIDWAFSVEENAWKDEKRSSLHSGEAYLQAKLAVVNVFGGRKRSVYGNQDPELSSGGMIWSSNARALPRIGIESNDFVDVPFTKGFLELKGGLSHGWYDDSSAVNNILLHHKYVYGRIGGRLPVHLQFGMQHVAQWGGTANGTHPFGPVSWSNYKRVFMGEAGDATATASDQINKLGNHILSKNMGLELNIKGVYASLYWQNIYEDGPVDGMFDANNREDGLWGASFRIPSFRYLNAFTLEYLSTTDQSGPFHDMDGVVYGGTDNYYNGQYPNGWSYDGMTSGNPWLTSRRYNKNGVSFITNNAVRLFYFSGKGLFIVNRQPVNYRLTLAYSKNYGKAMLVMPPSKNQFSGLLECNGNLYRKVLDWTAGVALDRGKMYGNNTGLWLGVAAHWER